MSFTKLSAGARLAQLLVAGFLGAIIGCNNILIGSLICYLTAVQIEIIFNLYKSEDEDWWKITNELFDNSFRLFTVVYSFPILALAVFYTIPTNCNVFVSATEFRINSLEGFYSVLKWGLYLYVVIVSFKFTVLLSRSLKKASD